MRRRIRVVVAAAAGLALAAPAEALAHGLVGRQDLPIPEWLFGWAAALVLIVSFVALAALWPEPKLEDRAFRPLPAPVSRALTSRAFEVLAGAFGVFCLGAVIYSGLEGVQNTTVNLAPSFVYVWFWVGLVFISVLFGNVFRPFNPWRAVGRFFGWVAKTASQDSMPQPLRYPDWLGRWPAALALLGFTWLELVSAKGDDPDTLAIATIAYTAITLIGMSLFGVERWAERGEGFGVYFSFFARLSPFERRGEEIGLRKPLSGLTTLERMPGTVGVLAVMIGTVSFDGASEGQLWADVAPELTDFWSSLGFGPATSIELSFTVGLLASVLIVMGLYYLGVAGAKTVGGSQGTRDLARRFVHSLVPIAFAYVAAHYLTLLLYNGQSIAFLPLDPLGNDADLDRSIDYGVIGATAAWYWQVGFVVSGHLAGLSLAHDRALVLYSNAKQAVRSQAWMLAVMVGFTSLALWLLSEANG